MSSKLSGAPSPRTFAEAYQREILNPARDKIADDAGAVDGDATLTGADVLLKSAVTQADGQDVSTFIQAQTQAARDAAAAASGPDGRLSKADAEKLPQDMRLAFHFLRTGELPAPATTTPSVRFSQNVMNDVMQAYGLTDQQALIDTALKLGDGNAYLNRTELEAAANALRAETDLTTFDFSDNVVNRVMQDFNIGDRGALLREATKHDADGNRYLRRSELEAAAKILTGALEELGVISDIDKTLLPPNRPQGLLPPPYPGIKQLLHELEGSKAGDVHYVTARDPASVAADDVPGWMTSHGLPDGSIDTGVSPLPWVAQPEKVKDISAHFDANPNQSFVLFGDNSHTDHKAYSDIMAKYPGRVVAAFIHEVKNRNFTPPAGMYMIDEYATPTIKLLELGKIDVAAAERCLVAAQVEGLNITDAEIDAKLAPFRS
jgi:hypothetical protein